VAGDRYNAIDPKRIFTSNFGEMRDTERCRVRERYGARSGEGEHKRGHVKAGGRTLGREFQSYLVDKEASLNLRLTVGDAQCDYQSRHPGVLLSIGVANFIFFLGVSVA
jgi:hypothetical protein